MQCDVNLKHMLFSRRKQKIDGDDTSKTTKHKYRGSERGVKHPLNSQACALPSAPRLSGIAAIPEGFRSLEERENTLQKKMLRLKHQFEMMGTLTCDIFDIRVACVSFVFTDLYYLCGKLNDKFDF